MKIKNIVNFSSEIYKNCDNYQSKFSKMAHFIFKNFKLNSNESSYSVEEVEFNYYDTTLHSDPYVKYDNEKFDCGNWYFNKNNGKHTKGSKRGLGITIGNRDENVYATVLIRSIYNLKNNKLIEGPDKVLDELLKASKFKTLKGFIGKGVKSIRQKFNSDLYFSLVGSDMKIGKSTWHCLYGFYKGPRVGLELCSGGIYKERFIMRPYRFVAFREKKVKIRGQKIKTKVQPIPKTMKCGIALNKYFFGTDELTRETLERYGLKEKTCTKWMDDSEKGLDKKYSDFYDKKLSKKKWMELYRLWINTHGLTNPMREYDPEEHKEIDNELLDKLGEEDRQEQNKNNPKLFKQTIQFTSDSNKKVSGLRDPTREEKHQILSSICGDKKALEALLKQMSFEQFRKLFEIDTVDEHNERMNKQK
jgi:hypothetical protein